MLDTKDSQRIKPQEAELLVKIDTCFRVIASFSTFVSDFLWIEDKETSQAIRFQPWDSQKEILIPAIESDDWLIAIKARQLGFTWMTAAYCLWLAITRPLQQILVISYNQDIAQEFLQRVRFILARIPDYLIPKINKDTAETFEFVHTDEQNNQINSIIQSLPSTPKGGQSKTPTLLIIDESAWNQYFREIYTATEPGIDAAGGRIIVISNAMKRAPGWSFTKELYINSMQGNNRFKRIFIPWWGRPGRSREPVWDEHEKKDVPLFIWQQKYEKNKHDEDIVEHYPETEDDVISSIGGSYFGKSLSNHTLVMQGEVGDIIDTGFIVDRRGICEVWKQPVAGWHNRYCIGADVSEGVGSSYSVAYIYDRLTHEFVARVRSNRISAHVFAGILYDLSTYYKNADRQALVCVERTGAGQTTVAILQERRANQFVRIRAGKFGMPSTKEFGWHESEQAKHDLSEDLRQWFSMTESRVYCPVLLSEASTWIMEEGSRRLGPEQGRLGDCVIAAGLTIQADKSIPVLPTEYAPDTQRRIITDGNVAKIASREYQDILQKIRDREEGTAWR